MSIITSKECQTVEYKRSWKDEYLKWICGFANAQGATMFLGVDDNMKLYGLPNAKRLLEDIPNKINTTMGLVVDVDLHEQDGLEYLEVTIVPANVPISYRGKYYYRSGSTLQELTGTALTDFLMRKLNITWDATTEKSATINDIDPEAVNYFLNAAIEEGRINKSAKNLSIEQLLHRLHLINKDNGQLTLAALLLFGKDVERWNMTVAFRLGRFGNSEADLIIQDKIVCPLIEMPDKVIETLRTKYLISPIHYEELRRKEPLEIPEDGLREMLCNSLIHKDYTGTFIQMKVFNERITLWNAGTLPPGYTVEKLMEPHESHPRNRLMANVFYLAGFIESWGRGYEKIREAFEKEKLQVPVFEEVRGGIMVTIKRESFLAIQTKGGYVENKKNVVDDVVEKMTERQKIIYKMIKKSVVDNVVETANSIACKMKLSPRTIQRELTILRELQVIKHDGPDKGGRWVTMSDLNL
jgi:ATP-dependent DNA helicase RecG